MYSNSILTVGEDIKRDIVYRSNSFGGLVRVHYRVSRMSGERGVYRLRHFADSSNEDRARAEAFAHRVELPRFFELLKEVDGLYRRRYAGDRRRWVEYALLGEQVSDPLVQLELETMIDEHNGRSSAHTKALVTR